MTNQSEDKRALIREVIDAYTDDRCLFPDRVCNALGSGYCSSGEEAYNCLMEKLTELGLVIQVEEELPISIRYSKEAPVTIEDAVITPKIKRIIKALKLVRTFPLIGEEK